MDLPLLKNIGDLKGKRVLLRASVNEPTEDGIVLDDFRLKRIVPTVLFLKEKGAHVIIIGHNSDREQSLRPVFNYFKNIFPIRFVTDIYNTEEIVGDGDEVVLCENLRFWEGEEANDPLFAEHLASLGDVYVNDAFSTSHREHASIVEVPKLLPHYAGLVFEEEVRELSQVFTKDKKTLVIVGGNKSGTKIPLLSKIVDTVEHIFIGGALANNFFRQKGYEIGRSYYDKKEIDFRKLEGSEKVSFPSDVVVKNSKGVFVKSPFELDLDDKISDAGPETIASLKEKINDAGLVIFNGPIGEYKHGDFDKGTREIIEHISSRDIVSIIGGGDTVGIVYESNKEEYIDFLSTGGGAMLDFLANKTLPGILALTS